MKTKIITILLGTTLLAMSATAAIKCDYQETPCDAHGNHYYCYRQIFANIPGSCSPYDISNTGGRCHHMNRPCFTANSEIVTEEPDDTFSNERPNEFELLINNQEVPMGFSNSVSCPNPRNECVELCTKKYLKGQTPDENSCRSLDAFCDVFCGGW
jgi:hypothetical protein